MLPELTWTETTPTRHESTGPDYAVTCTQVAGASVGYPQCATMWHMRFNRGGCHASAYLEALGAAQWNAARIVASMRGTHDDYGNPKKRRA